MLGVDNPGGRKWTGQCSSLASWGAVKKVEHSDFCPVTTIVESHLVTLVGDAVCFLLRYASNTLHLIM